VSGVDHGAGDVTALPIEAFFSSQYLDHGIALFKQNRFVEAVSCFDYALELYPDDKYARWNRATALLSMGDYERGFKEHDVAWTMFDWRGFGPVRDDIDRLRALPIWEGQEADSLLVYHELGFGDAIQTLRYLPELKARARHVTLVINPELVRLAEPFGVEVVTAVPDDLSGYAYRLPMFGVLSALKQTRDNIPREPYINIRDFSQVTKVKSGRVGICWSGRTQTAFALDYFLSMFDHAGFELHALQLGPISEVVKVNPLGSKDFADTVNVMAAMDHIVTIDSAAAHLAGAMGHPSVHLLLPFFSDWRWNFTDVWYPNIKTYRQPKADDWATPFARLNEALHS
jgi:tetratricopeptide (TPR) repeat protein